MFTKSDEAEILTAASSYIQLSAVKISASSGVEKVDFGTIFCKKKSKNRGKYLKKSCVTRKITF